MANLRTADRLCLWCEAIVTVRILEKTGALARADDPEEINELGRIWYWLWKGVSTRSEQAVESVGLVIEDQATGLAAAAVRPAQSGGRLSIHGPCAAR